MMPYRGGNRWVAPHAGTRAPNGTGFLWVRVRNGPVSRKLPQAHNRNPTFLEVVVSVVPSPAGVRRRPTAPTVARAVSQTSTSCPNPDRPLDCAWIIKLDDRVSLQTEGGDSGSVLKRSSGWTAAFQVLLPTKRLALSILPRCPGGPWRMHIGYLPSTVSGPRCAESKRDVRACRFHSSSIYAQRDALRHGSGRGCAQPFSICAERMIQRKVLLLPGNGRWRMLYQQHEFKKKFRSLSVYYLITTEYCQSRPV